MLEGISLKAILYAVGFLIASLLIWRTIVYFEDVGYQRAVNHYEAILSKAKAESLQAERTMQQKVDAAEQKGADREKQHKVEVAVLDSSNRRLRDDINTFRVRLSAGSNSSCYEAVNTSTELFAECADRLSEVAKAADGHANDASTCAEAWPK